MSTIPPNLPPCRKGDRIRLTHMGLGSDSIPVGTTGSVVRVTRLGGGDWQIIVNWDIDRSLNLSYPTDRFDIIRHHDADQMTIEGEPT